MTTTTTERPGTLYDLITDAVHDILDRLIEAGGGTDYGIAEYLRAEGVTGEPAHMSRCVIAAWLIRELALRYPDLDWLELEVVPDRRYLNSNVTVLVSPAGWVWLPLPPVFSDLGDDFDKGRYPELERA